MDTGYDISTSYNNETIVKYTKSTLPINYTLNYHVTLYHIDSFSLSLYRNTETENEIDDMSSMLSRIFLRLSPSVLCLLLLIWTFYKLSKKKSRPWQQLTWSKMPKGIPNLGNTCYMNSILQVLCWTPLLGKQLQKQLMSWDHNANQPWYSYYAKKVLCILPLVPAKFRAWANTEEEKTMTFSLFNLIASVHGCDTNLDSAYTIENYLPQSILDQARKINSQFEGHSQQDSFEMFNAIMSGIEDEQIERFPYKADVESSALSHTGHMLKVCPISQLIGGMFITVYQYETCNHTEAQFQRFTSICVPVPENRKKALDEIAIDCESLENSTVDNELNHNLPKTASSNKLSRMEVSAECDNISEPFLQDKSTKTVSNAPSDGDKNKLDKSAHVYQDSRTTDTKLNEYHIYPTNDLSGMDLSANNNEMPEHLLQAESSTTANTSLFDGDKNKNEKIAHVFDDSTTTDIRLVESTVYPSAPLKPFDWKQPPPTAGNLVEFQVPKSFQEEQRKTLIPNKFRSMRGTLGSKLLNTNDLESDGESSQGTNHNTEEFHHRRENNPKPVLKKIHKKVPQWNSLKQYSNFDERDKSDETELTFVNTFLTDSANTFGQVDFKKKDESEEFVNVFPETHGGDEEKRSLTIVQQVNFVPFGVQQVDAGNYYDKENKEEIEEDGGMERNVHTGNLTSEVVYTQTNVFVRQQLQNIEKDNANIPQHKIESNEGPDVCSLQGDDSDKTSEVYTLSSDSPVSDTADYFSVQSTLSDNSLGQSHPREKNFTDHAMGLNNSNVVTRSSEEDEIGYQQRQTNIHDYSVETDSLDYDNAQSAKREESIQQTIRTSPLQQQLTNLDTFRTENCVVQKTNYFYQNESDESLSDDERFHTLSPIKEEVNNLTIDKYNVNQEIILHTTPKLNPSATKPKDVNDSSCLRNYTALKSSDNIQHARNCDKGDSTDITKKAVGGITESVVSQINNMEIERSTDNMILTSLYCDGQNQYPASIDPEEPEYQFKTFESCKSRDLDPQNLSFKENMQSGDQSSKFQDRLSNGIGNVVERRTPDDTIKTKVDARPEENQDATLLTKDNKNQDTTIRLQNPDFAISLQSLKASSHMETDIEKGLMELTSIEQFPEEILCCRICEKDRHPAGEKAVHKRLMVQQAPGVLVLQINRFKQTYEGKLEKIQGQVTYPKILDFAPFCSTAVSVSEKEADEILYRLYGVVVHSGTVQDGHYTAFVRTNILESSELHYHRFVRPRNDPEVFLDDILDHWNGKGMKKIYEDSQSKDTWFYISDTFVEETTEKRVLEEINAYILMYERIK